MRYERWKGSNHWAVYNDSEELVNITLYKKGAVALIQQIMGLQGRTEEEIQETLLKSEQANKPVREFIRNKNTYRAER